MNETMNSSAVFSQDDIEDEYALDEALSKIEGRLQSFRQHSRLMTIGQKKYELLDADPIYFLTGPIKNKTKNEICNCC